MIPRRLDVPTKMYATLGIIAEYNPKTGGRLASDAYDSASRSEKKYYN